MTSPLPDPVRAHVDDLERMIVALRANQGIDPTHILRFLAQIRDSGFYRQERISATIACVRGSLAVGEARPLADDLSSLCDKLKAPTSWAGRASSSPVLPGGLTNTAAHRFPLSPSATAQPLLSPAPAEADEGRGDGDADSTVSWDSTAFRDDLWADDSDTTEPQDTLSDEDVDAYAADRARSRRNTRLMVLIGCLAMLAVAVFAAAWQHLGELRDMAQEAEAELASQPPSEPADVASSDERVVDLGTWKANPYQPKYTNDDLPPPDDQTLTGPMVSTDGGKSWTNLIPENQVPEDVTTLPPADTLPPTPAEAVDADVSETVDEVEKAPAQQATPISCRSTGDDHLVNFPRADIAYIYSNDAAEGMSYGWRLERVQTNEDGHCVVSRGSNQGDLIPRECLIGDDRPKCPVPVEELYAVASK